MLSANRAIFFKDYGYNHKKVVNFLCSLSRGLSFAKKVRENASCTGVYAVERVASTP